MPAVERQYQPGDCQNPRCQRDLGIAYQYGGRNRRYCDDKCKMQAARYRQAHEKAMDLAKQVRGELRLSSYELPDDTLALVADLADFGPEAIRAGVRLAASVAKVYREKAERKGIWL